MKTNRTIDPAMVAEMDSPTENNTNATEVSTRASEGEPGEHERVHALTSVARASAPDPEVAAKPSRRQFSAAYKLKILQEADRCSTPGEIGVLLRREGLYSSHLVHWRKQRKRGELTALAPHKRGRKQQEVNPLAREVVRLQKENELLQARLKQAETIIEVQKKVSQLLGISLAEPGDKH